MSRFIGKNLFGDICQIFFSIFAGIAIFVLKKLFNSARACVGRKAMFLSSLFTCMQMQSANCMFYILELRLLRSCTTTFWSRLLGHFLAKFFTFPLEFFYFPSPKTHNLHWRMFRKPRLRLSSLQNRSGKEMFSDICFGSSVLQHNLRLPFFPNFKLKRMHFSASESRERKSRRRPSLFLTRVLFLKDASLLHAP